MPCLVLTGASGFIGSALSRAWINLGWKVHILSRDKGESDDLSRHVWPAAPTELGDLLRQIKPDMVVHLATCYIKDHRPEDVLTLVEANIKTGALLLEGCRLAGIHRLLTAGTAWQHFHHDGEGFRAANLYAATKQAFEDLARYYSDAFGFRVIALHLSDTYGPNDPRPKLFTLLADAVISGRVLELSPGGQALCPIHIEDVVTAFTRAAENLMEGGEPEFSLYRVSGDEVVTLVQLVNLWCHVMQRYPQIKWGARPYRDREIMRPWMAGPRLSGWSPSWRLEDGLRTLAPGNG